VNKTTTNLSLPSPRRWRDVPTPSAVAICLFGLLAIAALFGKLHSGHQAAAVPTPALDPIIIIATSPAAVPPTAAPIHVAAVLPAPRYVVGFDSPNGQALGAIPAPEASAIVARFGDAWLQTTHDGAPIWIRATELYGATIADLAPTAAPAVIYVASEPQSEAAPTSVPQAAEAAPVVWATSGPIRKEDFVTVDPKARCQFVGCL